MALVPVLQPVSSARHGSMACDSIAAISIGLGVPESVAARYSKRANTEVEQPVLYNVPSVL